MKTEKEIRQQLAHAKRQMFPPKESFPTYWAGYEDALKFVLGVSEI